MSAVITGVGLVTPLGSSLEDLAAALLAGRVAAGSRAIGFEERAGIPSRRARRMSRLALMALAAGRAALADAGLDSGDRIAVVLATGFGALGVTVDFMRSCLRGEPDPALFPTSVLNEPAAQLAIELGLRGPNLTVVQHERSFHAAIAAAEDLLALGRADAVLVGGCDELGPEMQHALGKLGLSSPSGIARPFDRKRDGIVPGEAAAMYVLARDGARVHARFGPAEIDYVALEGNGSRALDREVAKRHRGQPAGSILGATGEFATSAALRVAQAIVALRHGVLAGTPGFEDADPEAAVAGLLTRAVERHARGVAVPCGDVELVLS